ncbi:MAG: hypothetical protein M1284_00375 [Candidatus Parvarchaeota archaeon]|jgi:uncharacterized protein (UPF0332 family)|nr:hypothetical protein [Candidatus Parvarchaeota archaeon]MCL5420196.1 hypothetical protein [Candidatus Parvarchaeota archaeon]
MLDKERIASAEKNVKAYLYEGLLKRTKEVDDRILNTFKKNADESLNVANFIFEENLSSLWVIVCSYYSMYYIANAVLYSLGYKVGHRISHKVTADTLIIFVRGKLKASILEEFDEAQTEALELSNIKADELVESFDFERVKRSKFQYEMTEEIKRSKAQTSLDRAKAFIFEMKKLLL